MLADKLFERLRPLVVWRMVAAAALVLAYVVVPVKTNAELGERLAI